MAKSTERNQAIELRKKGLSIKQIARQLGVSKSSASIWCREIILTKAQVEKLHKSMVKGGYAGRLKGARMQHEERLKRIEFAEKSARNRIGKLSERDLLIAAVALYWGEGSKKKRELAINNSDPEMVKFMVSAFRKLWGAKNSDFVFRIGINSMHTKRDEEIKKYWMEVTKTPIEQFRKTSFIKTKNKKNYSNFATHYGTLTIKIKKSTSIYYDMISLVKALSGAV